MSAPGITPREILRIEAETADAHGISVEVMRLSSVKHREVVAARWHVWRKAHERGASIAMIARVCGFDFSSVKHGLRKGSANA